MSIKPLEILAIIGAVLIALLAGYMFTVRGAQSDRQEAEKQLAGAREAVTLASQDNSGGPARAARNAARPLSPAELRSRLLSAAAQTGVEVGEISPAGSRSEVVVRGSGEDVLRFAAELQSDLKIRGGQLQASGPALLVISVDSDSLPEARVTVIPVSSLR